MYPHPDLFGIRPVPDGGKDVEFKRRKNAPARHVAADHFIQAVGKDPVFLASSQRVAEMFPMLDRHGLHRRGIFPDETIDGLSIAQVLTDDFRYIGRLHTPVPSPSEDTVSDTTARKESS
jgi:hypothetical protein